ncbi:unnamed protein product [Peniophora sp. CBMAI 1063]|nr:unnamed protein product [Peniophora sp. CBMAI 1063]
MASKVPSQLLGSNETLPVTQHHDVYSTIDPTFAWQSQTYRGKSVFITGASRGIGRSTAITFAKAGAAVAISARSEKALEETKALILQEAPEAKVETYAVDVSKAADMEVVMKSAAAAFGGLHVVIANAGYSNTFDIPMHERAPDQWWRTFEVNVQGVYNTLRASVDFLRQSGGYFIAVTSNGAQLRWPGGADYMTSKHAVNRLVEFIALENPQIKTFSLHPGMVVTELVEKSKLMEYGFSFEDSPELAASTMLYLCSGKGDWLNGRYVEATWDLGQIEREWKGKILDNGLLINKLSVN